MQIEVTEIEPCKLKINYSADPEKISNKRDEIVSHFKKAPVPGFRPGRASPQAIKYHYRNQIEESLKRALAEDAFHDTLFEKKLKPHGAPQFHSLFLGDGKFNCEFNLHTKPDFQLGEVKNLEIVKPHQETDTVAVAERMIQELRYRYGDVVPYAETDFVQSTDSIIVDYEVFLNNEKIDKLSAEGEMITVGKSDMPSFDENMLGMTVGETREFDFLVPEGGLPSFVGKTLHFKVTVNVGSKIIPCPLDDTLAGRLGKTDLTELKRFVTGAAQSHIDNKFKSDLNMAVANKLVDMHQIDVPNWLALSEAQYLAHQSKLDWNALVDEDKEKFLSASKNNVKLSLVLEAVRETEPEAQLSDQEVFDIIKKHLAYKNSAAKPVDEILKEMNQNGYLQVLFSRLKDEYTLDFIVKKARIIE